MLVLMNRRVFSGKKPGDIFEVEDNELTRLMLANGTLTSMELWEDRAKAEKIDDPWPE